MKSFSTFLTEQNRRLKIYCDMDETLVDFYPTANPIIDDYTDDTQWDKLDKHAWGGMGWKSGGKEIWEKIKQLDFKPWILTLAPVRGDVIYGKNYSILSKQSKSFVAAVKGKHAWIMEHLGEDQLDRTIVGPINFKKGNVIKHKPKGKKYVLVDDNPKYIRSWEEAGGIAIHRTTTKETLEKLNTL